MSCNYRLPCQCCPCGHCDCFFDHGDCCGCGEAHPIGERALALMDGCHMPYEQALELARSEAHDSTAQRHGEQK